MIARLLLTGLGALVAAGVGGATPSELPKGWWKGTIVLVEQWDEINEEDDNSRYKGTATLRIQRTAPSTASYELEYRREARWLIGNCPDEVRGLWTASVRKTAPIAVRVTSGRTGVVFDIAPELDAAVDGVRYTCGVSPQRYDAGSLMLHLGRTSPLHFGFTSKGSYAATSHRGTGPPRLPVFHGRSGEKPRPGGVNTSKVTWDLKLVQAAIPTGPVRVRQPVLVRLTPSAIRSAVRVTQGGKPARADSARCTTRLPLASEPSGYRTSGGSPQIQTGEVACPHVFNNTRFNGKVLEGTIQVTVGKTRVTKMFTVRIGPGKTLLSPKGAVIGKR